jgi:hypothetical protein
MDHKRSVTSGTAGSWSGGNVVSSRRLNEGVQQITQCYQVRNGSSTLALTTASGFMLPSGKQRSGLVADMQTDRE